MSPYSTHTARTVRPADSPSIRARKPICTIPCVRPVPGDFAANPKDTVELEVSPGCPCEYGFNVRGPHRLTIETAPANTAMLTIAATVGFVEDGRLREAIWADGERHDQVVFGLLAGEWSCRRKR